MKKIITLALAAAMLSATGITAFAETTNVSYNVDPSYTVTIPATVDLGDNDVTANIEASDVLLETGKQNLHHHRRQSDRGRRYRSDLRSKRQPDTHLLRSQQGRYHSSRCTHRNPDVYYCCGGSGYPKNPYYKCPSRCE